MDIGADEAWTNHCLDELLLKVKKLLSILQMYYYYYFLIFLFSFYKLNIYLLVLFMDVFVSELFSKYAQIGITILGCKQQK